MIRLAGPALILLALVSSGCAVFQNVGVDPRRGRNWDAGPIEHEDETIFTRNHLTWGPMSTKVLDPGRTRARAAFAWTNTNNFNPRPDPQDNFLMDYESRTLDLEVNHGIAPGLEVGVSVPILWRGDGELDWVLLKYHELTGLPLAQRDIVPHYDFAAYGPKDDGSRYEWTATGTEIGDVTLEGRWLLTEGSETSPAVTLIGRTRLPTATHDEYGADGIDLGGMLVASKRWNDFTLYGGAGIAWFSDTTGAGNVVYPDVSWIGFLALEYRFFDWFSMQWSLYAVNPMLDEAPDFDQSLFLMNDLSGVFRLSETFDLEVMLRENITPQSSSVDVTFFFGLVAHF